MRSFLLTLLLPFVFFACSAQPGGAVDPVKWSGNLVKVEEGVYQMTINATIEDGWYVYSQNIDPEVGPVPTSFMYNEAEGLELIGATEETSSKVKEGLDPIWEAEIKKFGHDAKFVQRFKLTDPSIKISGSLEFMTCNDEMCLPPKYVDFEFDPATGGGNVDGNEIKIIDTGDAYGSFGEPITKCVEEEKAEGFWMFLLLGFAGGLLALITPCVFPMIPLTVSFFTKGNKSKAKGIFDASFYGFSIIFIYFLLSLPFALLEFSPSLLNEFSTNPILNIVFFVVFVVFAISFFGVFEITLPSSFANRADKASDVGGLVGIFFMAVTLAIVSFSCTGPIIGSLLVGALTTEGGQMNLIAGMVGFGTALAFPFALFAAFPGYLNKLPKSGGWLNSVKVVLGFIEVAFAFKFFSNADLVMQWHILPREIFLGAWIIIGIGLSLYLFGIIKFPHDSPINKLSNGRKAFGLAVVAFTLYLIPGLFGANLKLMSGFPPPMSYSLFYEPGENHIEPIMNDFDAALAQAKETGKPVFLDFTGWACVNCRQMEENVWIEPDIHKLLQDEFVVVSLYVDERTDLPEEEYFDSEALGKTVTTVGNKWQDMQASNFKAVSQPWYVLITPTGRIISNPLGATDAGSFQDYLECGLTAYKQGALNIH